MSSQFCHLHLHTQYSLLDGANKVKTVIQQAVALGQPAIAMTDHGNLHGALDFYNEAKKAGVKPIIGCELYVAPTSRFERKGPQGEKSAFHLTVLSQNAEGYRNLCRLVSRAYKEGFYFKPRVDHELLQEYNEGLVIMSGCLGGELASFIERDNIEKARELAEFYIKTFGDRFYFEVQPHPIPEQRKLNLGCIELAKSMGIPLVATTDCHYCLAEDHYAQEILMCISTGKTINDPDRLKHDGVQLHLKSHQEMYDEFGEFSYKEEALRNAVEIANRCDLSFDFSKHFMPRYSERSEDEHMTLMAEQSRVGLERRLAALKNRSIEFGGKPFTDEDAEKYRERLEEEIRLIGQMGFGSYFLVVSDFIVWAKENGIPVGPGRGSAAGSLVAYAMRITDVDPIANKLLFERFLNPERISLPDIDVDFCINGRAKVVQYVAEKYGKDRVAQIATFGTLKAKAAIKDVGRALGMSFAETDKVASLVPAPRQGFDYPIAEAIKMEPKLQEIAEGSGKDFLSLAMKLEGLTRHTSTHAAGVVIGDRPLMELLPMMVDKDGNDVTQFSMGHVEKVGLVKFDFLGLKTLTVLQTACDIIKESKGVTIDLEALPLQDPKTYSLLSSGNTTGVFQLESGGITEMTIRLKPNCFDDLVAILALYRPGPLDAGMVDRYIERKHGREQVIYLHPKMETVLQDTYGIMLYQEQIMQLARVLAGYSLGEADLLRKAMGKKIPEEMRKQRDRFLRGTNEAGIKLELAEEIFDQMETFARYGFNRSHSVAYALISFQTAYLKAHYPVEFMAALMSHEMDDTDKILKNLSECRKQKIEVLPPSVNESGPGFTVRSGKIRYGLEALKGIGEKAVSSIIEARTAGGPFVDAEDFLERVDIRSLNRKVFESLVKCGALDGFSITRRELFDRCEELLKLAQGIQKKEDSGQLSLFGEGSEVAKIARRRLQLPEWPSSVRLSYERETLGTFISGHPLERYKQDLKKRGALSTQEVREKGKQQRVQVAGVVTALKLKNTKKGDRYASFSLEDDTGTIEALVWPDNYRKLGDLLEGEEPLLVTARADATEERCTLIVEELQKLSELRDKEATQGILVLGMQDTARELHERLKKILVQHVGTCPVKIKLDLPDGEVVVTLRDESKSPVRIAPSERLCNEVEELFGRPVLSFQ